MTGSKSGPANSGGKRRAGGEARDLGAFGATSPKAGEQRVNDRDLASLLDVEFWAAERGSLPQVDRAGEEGTRLAADADLPATSLSEAGGRTASSAVVDAAEASGIDMPGLLPKARSVVPAPDVDSTPVRAARAALPAAVDSAAATLSHSENQRVAMLARLDGALESAWERRLHGEIEQLYQEVVAASGELPDLADEALVQLREARQILVESPEAYGAAEYQVSRVRASLRRQQESARQARHYGPRVMGYQALWLALLVAGLFAGEAVARLGESAFVAAGVSMEGFLLYWRLMMWAGLGGAIGAIYHLTRHIGGKADFDRRYVASYLVRPLIGVVIGGALGLVLNLALSAAGGVWAESGVGAIADALVKLLAVLLGFLQGRLYRGFRGSNYAGGDVGRRVQRSGSAAR